MDGLRGYALISCMQILGLAESTPRTESRLKSLFWPSVTCAEDVDYLGAQGYWICTIVAVFSAGVLSLVGPLFAIMIFLFYYLGGVGVREGSRFAATLIFLNYFVGFFQFGFSVPRILITVVLFSNLRAAWIASRWKGDAEHTALTERPDWTLADKFANVLPRFLWGYLRIPYYVYSVGLFVIFITVLVRARM